MKRFFEQEKKLTPSEFNFLVQKVRKMQWEICFLYSFLGNKRFLPWLSLLCEVERFDVEGY